MRIRTIKSNNSGGLPPVVKMLGLFALIPTVAFGAYKLFHHYTYGGTIDEWAQKRCQHHCKDLQPVIGVDLLLFNGATFDKSIRIAPDNLFMCFCLNQNDEPEEVFHFDQHQRMVRGRLEPFERKPHYEAWLEHREEYLEVMRKHEALSKTNE